MAFLNFPGNQPGPESAEAASLFRQAALDHPGRENGLPQTLRIPPPWTWSLVRLLALFTVAGPVGAFEFQ